MEIEKSDQQGRSQGILFDKNPLFLAYHIKPEIKLDINNLKNLKVKISDKATGITLNEETRNLYTRFNSFGFLNTFSLPMNLEYKDNEFEGLLIFDALLFPRNLEVAQLIFNEQMMDVHFENFASLIREAYSKENV